MTTGHFGNAGNFDGIDDYVSTDLSFVADALTVAAWIKADSFGVTGHGAPIIGSYSDMEKSLQISDGQLTLALGGWVDGANSLLNGGAIALGVWTHVAVTWHPTNGFKSYINGILTKSVGTNLSQIVWNGITIGARRPLYPVSWFDGAIDEARVFDRELDAAEIVTLMNDAGP